MYNSHEITEQEHANWLASLRHNIIEDGVRVDVILMGNTKAEWQHKRPALETVIERLSAS